jgi:hypothetical protein
METIDQEVLRAVLAKAELNIADPRHHVGNELSFAQPPARTLVIYVGKRAERVAEIVLAILSLEDTWLLIPRYGDASHLGFGAMEAGTGALSFAPSEYGLLGRYLRERPMDLGAVSADLYVLGSSGNVLATWDHHTDDEGLSVQLRRVDDSNRLLLSLNGVGAEMQVICAPG